MKKITVSAPGKLLLFGEHAVVYGRPCIVTAVNQRMSAGVELLKEPVLRIDAPDVSVSGYEKQMSLLGTGDIPKGALFIEHTVKNIASAHSLLGGVHVTTSSEFTSTVGFGSSSASAVCVAKALSELFLFQLTGKEMFDVCYKTVIDIQGVGSGFDVASAIFGGTIYYVMPGKTIEPLYLNGLPLVVGYTGVKADTATIIKELKARYEHRENDLHDICDDIARIVEKATTSLKGKQWKEAGFLMNENQKHLETIGVSSAKLRDMIAAALSSGAYGAKLSGAGVGDCMIALVPEEKRIAVEKAIMSVGGEIMHVNTNAEGVRVEHD